MNQYNPDTQNFTNICGGSDKDIASIRVDGRIKHTASSLTFSVIAIDSGTHDTPIFGFRDVSLLFQSNSITSNQACILDSAPTSSASCLCNEQFFSPIGSSQCELCNSACQNCFAGSTKLDCTSCPAGSSFNGTTCIECDPSCNQCNGTEVNSCTRCASDSYLYWNGTCYSNCDFPLVTTTEGQYQSCDLPCDVSKYYYQNATCQANCPSKFISLIQGDLKICNFTCQQSQYLYSNGTCSPICSSPFTPYNTGIEAYCNFPCPSNQFLYENGSCQQNCTYPYRRILEGDYNYCNFPCLISQYLYWNGSCFPTCPISFQSTIIGRKYCKLHCEVESNLYWNNTCEDSCSKPLIQLIDSESYKVCKLPCNESQYLYPNGSCLTECAYKKKTDGNGVTYCQYPCDKTSFLYQNDSCLISCGSPYTINTIDAYLALCNLPCPLNQYYVESGRDCVSNCTYPSFIKQNGNLLVCQPPDSTSSIIGATQSINKFSSALSSAIRPSNSNSAFVTALAKLVKYVKYLQVPILDNVRNELNSNASSGAFSISMAFTIPMPQSLKSKFTMHPLPQNFEASGYHSSYLVNHWESISNYVLLFAAGVLFSIIEIFVRSYKNRVAIAIFRRIRVIFKWNFFWFALFNTYDDLTFFPTLEIRTLKFDSIASIISFVTCVVLTLGAIYMLIKLALICNITLKAKRQVLDTSNTVNQSEIFYIRWEHCQCLIAGFKNDTLINQAFLLLSTLRIIYCYLLAGVLYMYPLVQTVQFLILSFAMLYYVLIKRPIVDPINFIVILIFEILVLIINICVFILAVEQNLGTLTLKTQTKLSEIILITNTAVNTCSSIFTWVYVVYAMYGAFKISRKLGIDGKTSWFNVLIAPYQNPGMDFDEKSNQAIYLANKATQQTIEYKHKRFKKNILCYLRSLNPLYGRSNSEASVKEENINKSYFSSPKFSRRVEIEPQRTSKATESDSNNTGIFTDVETDGTKLTNSTKIMISPANNSGSSVNNPFFSKEDRFNIRSPKSSSQWFKPSNLQWSDIASPNSKSQRLSSEEERKRIRENNGDKKALFTPSAMKHSIKLNSYRNNTEEIFQQPIKETSDEVLPTDRFRNEDNLVFVPTNDDGAPKENIKIFGMNEVDGIQSNTLIDYIDEDIRKNESLTFSRRVLDYRKGRILRNNSLRTRKSTTSESDVNTPSNYDRRMDDNNTFTPNSVKALYRQKSYFSNALMENKTDLKSEAKSLASCFSINAILTQQGKQENEGLISSTRNLIHGAIETTSSRRGIGKKEELTIDSFN